MTKKEINIEIDLILDKFPSFESFKSGTQDLYKICQSAMENKETQKFFETAFVKPECIDQNYKNFVIAKYFGIYKLLLEYLT